MRKKFVVLEHVSASEFERQLNERAEEGYKPLALTCSGETYRAVMHHPTAGYDAEEIARLFQQDVERFSQPRGSTDVSFGNTYDGR